MEGRIPRKLSLLERIEVKQTGWVDELAINLRARQQKEVRAMSTPEPGQISTAEDVPVFLVLSLNSQPIVCGGLRPLSPAEGEASCEAEVKRMYVLPELRGKDCGVSDFILKQLEAHALESGWTTTKVETGRDMERARRFYTRHGHAEIPLFGHYVNATHSVWYEKNLSR